MVVVVMTIVLFATSKESGNGIKNNVAWEQYYGSSKSGHNISEIWLQPRVVTPSFGVNIPLMIRHGYIEIFYCAVEQANSILFGAKKKRPKKSKPNLLAENFRQFSLLSFQPCFLFPSSSRSALLTKHTKTKWYAPLYYR